jgi:ketosteroid isomerase-like protein
LEEWAEVATFDLPGIGAEPMPDGIEADPERAPNLLASWRAAGVETGLREVARLGWDRFVVITDDLGAPTAVEIAKHRRGAALGLALGHASLSHATEGERAPMNAAIWQVLAQLAHQGSEQFVRYGIAQATQGGISEEVAQRMIERFPDMGLVSATVDALARAAEPIGEDLAELGLPMLFAKHDGCLGRTDEGFEDVIAAFPAARTAVCAETCASSPSFADAIRDFCESISEDNVELMQRMLGAFNGDDVHGVLATFDEDCMIVEPPEMPDTPHQGFRGHDGVRAWMANLRGIGGIEFTATSAEAKGDVVLSEWTARGLGQTSGAPIAWTTFAVLRVRDGRISRAEAFLSEDEARSAAARTE